MSVDLDVLKKLLPLEWRGIPVPCQQNDLEIHHNLVEHNQYAVAGGEQENTCRKSARFSFRIPFRCGLSGYQHLYPQTYRDFYNACVVDKSTGPLVHPEHGKVNCKVDTFKVSWQPNARDGADVDVVWVESIERGFTIERSSASPITYAIGLASDLEKMSGIVPGLPPEYDDGSDMTLRQALNKIKGAVMFAEMSFSQTLGQISDTINCLNDMIDTVNSIRDPSSWAVLDALKGIEASLQELKTTVTPGTTKKLDFKYTAADQAPDLLAASLGASLEDFFKLNPMMATYDVVPAGTLVFVYV